MMTENPRIMLAAPCSGSGKTTVTIALLQALKNRGRLPAAFKCGPDYIDPMFHRKALGVPGHNLDLFLASPDAARGLLASQYAAADIAVLEGVMGYYDGAGMTPEASSWHLAGETATPAVLVVRPGGSSLSAAALVKGFANFRENSHIKGVLLNGCAAAAADRLAGPIERESGVRVYGSLPNLPRASLESRHLGLVTPDSVPGLVEKFAVLARGLEENADVGGLLALAGTAPPLHARLPAVSRATGFGVRIAVAQDEAFCFYYRENFDLLERLGAELVFFSPLRDGFPDRVGGLYIGGGYPEIYAKTLSENIAVREAIKRAVTGGLPTIAECGGFLYLQQSLEDEQGVRYPMAGAVEGEGIRRRQPGHFGYVTLTAREDNLICPRGGAVKAHEFHYWDSTGPGDGFDAKKPHGDRHWACVQAGKTLYAGFPHLYFYSSPETAERFVQAASGYMRRKNH